MATYNQVKHGSSGDDVLELQKQLNANGYSLKEDGVFGSATQSAVIDYQTNNKLTVDGIVGDQTWGSLYNKQGHQERHIQQRLSAQQCQWAKARQVRYH